MTNVTPRSGRSAKVIAAAVVVGLIGSGALVWQASSAAFTASTRNDGNSWESGNVVLSDNDFAGANFQATGLKPGSTDTKCIEVEYDGNIAAAVKIYGEGFTGDLGQYLTLDISEGDGANCTTPGTLSRIYGDGNTTLDAGNDSLSEFAAVRTNWSTGAGAWAPSAANSVKPYVFTYRLVDDQGAMNETAEIDFVWEAQNT